MCTVLIILIIGCEENGNTNNKNLNSASSVEDVFAQGMSDQPFTGKVTPAPEVTDTSKAEPEEETPKGEDGIDVDLTILSSTMVYSEVYNMMCYPENYLGKTVKMSGMYTAFQDEETGNSYHACIIMDATACCAQGIEFELTDDYVYPDDYPKEGETICVTGTFETYMEGEKKYCTLKNALIKISNSPMGCFGLKRG